MRRRARRRAGELLGFVIGIIAVTSVAVALTGPAEPPPPDADVIYQIELTSYDKALAAWQRDSAVVDSVSRTIDTDTLYRLYRQLLTAADPVAARHDIACEEWRLGRRYQALPSIAATRRMRDTLWRPEDSVALRKLAARLPKVAPPRVGHWACGYPGEQRVPAELNGTSLIAAVSRPVPPSGPRSRVMQAGNPRP